MFGKKKNNDKLTTKQRFGIGLIESIAESMQSICDECKEAPGSYYAAECKRVITKLFNSCVTAVDQLQIVDFVPTETEDNNNG